VTDWSDDEPKGPRPARERRRRVYFGGRKIVEALESERRCRFVPTIVGVTSVTCHRKVDDTIGNTVEMQRPDERYAKGA
jgi:hypothetical protein